MIPSLLTVLCLSAASPQGPAVTFSDDTFEDADWQSNVIVARGTGGATAGQVQSGNPAPARRVTHDFQSGTSIFSIWTSHLMITAVYDPAIDGPIAQLHYALDAMNQSSSHRLNWALQQGSRTYVKSGPSTASVWTTFTSPALTANDFVERLPDGTAARTSHPDFSSSGAPITFGFETHNGSHAPGMLTVDYDNFMVTANGQPSAVDVRLGTPPNADVFRAVSGNGPVIGTTWNVAVDHQTFLPAATLDLVGLSAFTANVPTPLGTLLCNPMVVCIAGPAGQVVSVQVPDNVELLGKGCCLQAVSLDALSGTALLTNALDVTVGTF